MKPELIITFHGIGTPPAGVAADEIPYWIPTDDFRSFIASASEIAQAAQVTFLATFDDGNKSDIDIAAVELKKHSLKGMFFPCAARIDSPGYLSAADIQSLDADGFGIGSHGVDHIAWRNLDPDRLQSELAQSKAVLSDVIGREVVDAAIPFGAYDRATLRGLRNNGYRTIYSSDPGLSKPNARFRRRYSYVRNRGIDITDLAKRFATPRHRLSAGFKHFIKSRR